MHKQSIVRVLDTERAVRRAVITQRTGASQKVRRAPMLLQAAVEGPGWTDAKSADAFSGRVPTGERRRQRLVTAGCAGTRQGRKPATPPRENTCDGAPEATGMARRLGSPPQGGATGSWRRRAERGVARPIVETVGEETLRHTRKQTA